jgi:hypothetical protein
MPNVHEAAPNTATARKELDRPLGRQRRSRLDSLSLIWRVFRVVVFEGRASTSTENSTMIEAPGFAFADSRIGMHFDQ